MMNRLDRLRIAAFVVLGILALATAARAQAWVPSQGEGTISVVLQDSAFKYHRRPVVKEDRGHIRADAVVFDVTYGLTDRIAVDFSLPFIASNYIGPFPHEASGRQSIDGGNWHGTFQDFHFALRYNAHAGRFAVTPFVGTIMPSHDYEFFAHSAAGRRLRELQVGTYVARLLDPVIPGAFVQARYAYGFTERVLEISHNRSNASLELGYFVTPRLRVFGLAAGQLTHGGIDLTPDARTVLTAEQFLHHDQIDRLNFLDAGAGASVSLTDSVDLFASLLTNVTGRNGHVLGRGLNIAATWSFNRDGPSRAAEKRAQAEGRTLARCVCQKGE